MILKENFQITIYYQENSATWNISNFDPLGAKEIRFIPWNTDKIEQKDKDKDFFEKHKTLILIISILIVLIIIGIIIVIVIRKRRLTASDEIESLKGGLTGEMN